MDFKYIEPCCPAGQLVFRKQRQQKKTTDTAVLKIHDLILAAVS